MKSSIDFARAMGPENVQAMLASGAKAKAKDLPRRSGRLVARNKYTIGGAALLGTMGATEALMRDKDVKKSIEQSFVSKSEPVQVTGHGVNVEKRNFNAEADRQRRLGTYTGAGLGAGLVLGDAARRRVPVAEYELKDGRKIKRLELPKGRKGKATLAALAAGSLLSAGGGVAAYRRGISERNNTYL
jgi:hypothetical protein